METIEITVKPRYLSGSDVAKKVRRAGLLPAVMYGNGVPSAAIAVDPKNIKRGLTGAFGRNQMFQLTMASDGAQHLAIARDVQVHPVSRQLMHLDFFLVKPDSRIEVILPVVLSGRSAGQKAGGSLEHVSRFVRVACTPESLPKSVEIDVTAFENGAIMTIEQLPLPEGVVPVFKRSYKIFEIFAPKTEAVVEDTKKPAGKK